MLYPGEYLQPTDAEVVLDLENRRQLSTKLVFAASGTFLLLTTKNSGNLKSSTKCLIEQHPRLELGDEGEP